MAKLILLIFALLGIVLTILLLSKPQIFKSRATSENILFKTGVNIATAPSYGYKDLKPKSEMTDTDTSLSEVQKMGGSIVRVFVANNQISDLEAANRLGEFLDKAAHYNISVIPVFIDYYGGPWDRESMVSAYTNAACPGKGIDMDLSEDTVSLCDNTMTKTWSEIELELIWVNYASGHNPKNTNQYYTREGSFGILNNYFFEEGYKQDFKNFVETVVREEKDHPNIYAWEVGNELKASPQTFINFMRDISSTIKAEDPSHKIALGIINAKTVGLEPEDLYSQLPDIDIVTVHAYNGDRSGTDDVLWAKDHDKIALVEELGFSGTDDRSSVIKNEIEYWKSIGAEGILAWGFIAKGLGDNMDGDAREGFDDIHHTDYDQIFQAIRSVSNSQ